MALAERSRANNEVPGTVIGMSEGGGGYIVVSRNISCGSSRNIKGRQLWFKETVIIVVGSRKLYIYQGETMKHQGAVIVLSE